jgi:DNA polymerase III epsilon subunit-like protein
MGWTEHKIVAFDVETTGLSPYEGHRIVEFAALVMPVNADGQLREGGLERHEFLFDPQMDIPKEVVELTGISNEQVKGKPKFADGAQRICALLDGAITVAHNYTFDRSHVTHELRRAGLNWPDTLLEVDTLDLSRKFFSTVREHKLGQLSQRLGISLVNAHRASADAEACGRCFLTMAHRYEAPSEIGGLTDWAGALGRPPETGQIARGPSGDLVFAGGEFEGEPISQHPGHLAWMQIARRRVDDNWQHRFPDSLRTWVGRWLRIRGAGRAPSGGKSGSAHEWGLDSIARPVRR